MFSPSGCGGCSGGGGGALLSPLSAIIMNLRPQNNSPLTVCDVMVDVCIFYIQSYINNYRINIMQAVLILRQPNLDSTKKFVKMFYCQMLVKSNNTIMYSM